MPEKTRNTRGILTFLCILALLSCEDDEAVMQEESLKPGSFTLTIDQTSFDSASIRWTQSALAIRYVVFLEASVMDTLDADTSFTFRNLTGDITYQGNVMAINSEGSAIAPFTFTSSLTNFQNIQYILPGRMIASTNGLYPNTTRTDSTFYELTYDESGKITGIFKTEKNTSVTIPLTVIPVASSNQLALPASSLSI